jgi:hypothetical protein
MNIFRLWYTWECHKETSCTATLNKQKCHCVFLKNGEQEGRTGPDWGVGTSGMREDMGIGK